MKTLYPLLMFLLVLLATGCNKEVDPVPQWKFVPPVPEITDGPGVAQKMCYDFYQKYDLRVYYNLSGDTALRTDMGFAQTALIQYNNSAALPMQAADEVTAEKFLSLLTRFFALFPDEVVQKGLHRRHVLVKVNPAANRYRDELQNDYWLNTYSEDMQAIVYYGYLSNNKDTDNKLVSRFQDWKWGIAYSFLRGLAFSGYKPVAFPGEFGAISKGLYFSENKTSVDICLKYNYSTGKYDFDRNVGKKCGLLHPVGAMASNKSPIDDWGTFAAWILTEPQTIRSLDMASYPKLKQKYDLVVKFYKNEYHVDLEALSGKWQAVTLED